MNHLAHFHLAGDSDARIVGALLGDHIKGPLRGTLPESIETGIRLHRRIDAFTDSHPLVRQLKACFGPSERRLVGIVADMYFDHLLVLHWSRFHDQELSCFRDRVHAALDTHRFVLPPQAQAQFERMRTHDLLCRYRDIAVIEGTLAHIGGRLHLEPLMQSAMHQARRSMREVESTFLGFYPELITMALSAAEETR